MTAAEPSFEVCMSAYVRQFTIYSVLRYNYLTILANF